RGRRHRACGRRHAGRPGRPAARRAPGQRAGPGPVRGGLPRGALRHPRRGRADAHHRGERAAPVADGTGMSQDRFGLDDFRWVVDDPTPNEAGRPARRPFRNWLWRTIVFALVIGAGFALVTRAVGYAVPFVVPVTVLVALATLRRALGAVEAPRLRS